VACLAALGRYLSSSAENFCSHRLRDQRLARGQERPPMGSYGCACVCPASVGRPVQFSRTAEMKATDEVIRRSMEANG